MISEESTQTRLCNKADIVVISPEYRLAPDAPYPAAVEDVSKVRNVQSSGLVSRMYLVYSAGKSSFGCGSRVNAVWE